MAIRVAVSNLLKSKVLLVVLVLGNVALGTTTMMQSHIIDGQQRLIRLLYHDSAELANFKIAAIAAAHHDKH
jgi:hypothetical protein